MIHFNDELRSELLEKIPELKIRMNKYLSMYGADKVLVEEMIMFCFYYKHTGYTILANRDNIEGNTFLIHEHMIHVINFCKAVKQMIYRGSVCWLLQEHHEHLIFRMNELDFKSISEIGFTMLVHSLIRRMHTPCKSYIPRPSIFHHDVKSQSLIILNQWKVLKNIYRRGTKIGIRYRELISEFIYYLDSFPHFCHHKDSRVILKILTFDISNLKQLDHDPKSGRRLLNQ